MRKIEIDFPSWWVRTKLSPIRNRCVYDLQRDKSNQPQTTYKWTMCCDRSRNKLKLWFQKEPKKSNSEDALWTSFLAHQKAKLKMLYTIPNEWRATEYRILEKINALQFNKKKEIGCLWNFVAVSLANKANDKRILNRKYLSRQKNVSFNNVYGNFKIRIINTLIYSHHNTISTNWKKCFFANHEKIRNKIRVENWNRLLTVQRRKILYYFLN